MLSGVKGCCFIGLDGAPDDLAHSRLCFAFCVTEEEKQTELLCRARKVLPKGTSDQRLQQRAICKASLYAPPVLHSER